MVGAGNSVFKGEAHFVCLIIKCYIKRRMRLFSLLMHAFNSILQSECDESKKKIKNFRQRVKATINKVELT